MMDKVVRTKDKLLTIKNRGNITDEDRVTIWKFWDG